MHFRRLPLHIQKVLSSLRVSEMSCSARVHGVTCTSDSSKCTPKLLSARIRSFSALPLHPVIYYRYIFSGGVILLD